MFQNGFKNYNLNRSEHMTKRKQLKKLRMEKRKKRNRNIRKDVIRYIQSPKRYIEKLRAEGKIV